MKYVLIILALLTLVPSISRADSSTLEVDKAAHFGISFIATETGYAIGKKMKAGKTTGQYSISRNRSARAAFGRC